MYFPSISRLFCAKKGRCLSNGQGELSSFSLADGILSVTLLLVTLNEWRKITPPRRVIFPHNNNVCRVPRVMALSGDSCGFPVSQMQTAGTGDGRLPQGTAFTSFLFPISSPTLLMQCLPVLFLLPRRRWNRMPLIISQLFFVH